MPVFSATSNETATELGQADSFTFGASGRGTFRQRFSYHEIQFVTISGLGTQPSTADITGYRLTSLAARSGDFRCSNGLLNQMYNATVNNYRGLTTGGMTVDCPHRERRGFGGDAHTSYQFALSNYPVGAFFTKWMRDFADVQGPDGLVANTAPTLSGAGGPAWAGFSITAPWHVYNTFGDADILATQWPSMVRLMAFWAQNVNSSSSSVSPSEALRAAPHTFPSAPGLLHHYPPHGFLGDWVSPHGSEESYSVEAFLLNNCYYHYMLLCMVNISTVLGHGDAAASYQSQAQSIAHAVTAHFADTSTGVYLDERQTHAVMPLAARLVPPSLAPKTWDVLEHTLLVNNNSHLDTGLTGTYFMVKLLMESGRNDLIFSFANQTTYPGWGFFLSKGFTTWPEGWTMSSPVGAGSKMHGCFNSIGMWFIEGIVGIKIDHMLDPAVPLTIRAGVDSGDITWAEGQRASVQGLVRSSWAILSGGFMHNVSVPANAVAKVMIPSKHGTVSGITESGRAVSVAGANGIIKVLGAQAVNRVEYAVLQVLSGDYQFASQWSRAVATYAPAVKTDDRSAESAEMWGAYMGGNGKLPGAGPISIGLHELRLKTDDEVNLTDTAALGGHSKPLDVWLIPHSHCDTGWMITVDEYYNQSVQHILTTVTKQLSADANARFVWSETKWLSMWWPLQTLETQAAFRRIVKRKQFEFVGGGWSQNDETTTHFRDVIENQAIGHQWLRDVFGPVYGRVRWGWQIDMFPGYASTTPSLWAMMGYDGMVIRWEGKDAAMQAAWTAQKAYQFRWHPSDVLSTHRSEMFCHIIDGNYGYLTPVNSYVLGYGCDARDAKKSGKSPDGKACSWTCPTPGQHCTVPGVNHSNVAIVALHLISLLRNKSLPYRGPMMYPIGADFHYREAVHAFGNLSLVLAEVAAHPEKYGDATLRLSSLSEYMDHLHSLRSTEADSGSAGGIRFPVMTLQELAEFEWGWPRNVSEHGLVPFNYTNHSLQFQTGCLTSQAKHKQHARHVAVKTHAASVAHALATATAPPRHALPPLESQHLLETLLQSSDANGICQHHDSMPGTMEPAVLADYSHRLDCGDAAAIEVLSKSIASLAGGKTPSLHTDAATTAFFNPLAHARTEVAQMNLTEGKDRMHLTIFASHGLPVAAQLDYLDPLVVHFVATVPALSHEIYRMCSTAVECRAAGCDMTQVPCNHPPNIAPSVVDGAFSLNNSVLVLRFDRQGLLESVNQTVSHVSAHVTQELVSYSNGTGGAYILIETLTAKSFPTPTRVTTVRGLVLSEIVQEFGSAGDIVSMAQQRIRLLHHGHQETALVTTMLGAVQTSHEIVSRYRTDLQAAALETDSTGFESHLRTWDSRGIGANYHAMVQRASIVETTGDQHRQLALMTTHTMGCASLAAGQIEHMLIRRLVTSDNQGPAPLNEVTPINVTVALFLSTAADTKQRLLIRALELEHPLVQVPMSMAATVTQSGRLAPPVPSTFAGILVPQTAHLLSMSVLWDGTTAAGRTPPANSTVSVIVRWMNTAEDGPAITVPLGKFVQSLTGSDNGRCGERTLSLIGDRDAIEAGRLRWDDVGADASAAAAAAPHTGASDECGEVELLPLDVRTFEITW